LSNSQLLADFLSPHSMESQFLDKILPDVNLGKTGERPCGEHDDKRTNYACSAEQTKQTVFLTGKIIKAKGQHLEPFIQSFFNSCESPKPKPSRPELTILSPTSENDKKVGRLKLPYRVSVPGSPDPGSLYSSDLPKYYSSLVF
ncbi:Sorting nexin-14, partial [Goodea atripinnis]